MNKNLFLGHQNYSCRPIIISKMKNNDLELKKMFERFNELQKFEEEGSRPSPTFKKTTDSIRRSNNIRESTSKTIKSEKDSQPVQEPTKQREVMYTQSDIAKEVAKLKPYLAVHPKTKTSEQLEEEKNKQCSKQNYKMMSELIIIQNRKLCQVIEKAPKQEYKAQALGQHVEDRGWIFQIFYRTNSAKEGKKNIEKEPFVSGFALMTEIVEIFESLTFLQKTYSILPSDITLVRYTESQNYEVMRIEQGPQVIEVGFISEKNMDLFDRILFLQKSMSRSTNTRLFQNQLIRSIYAEF